MCRVPAQLRELVKQRLAAAAEEIFELVEKTITEYEEQLKSKYEQQRLQGALYTPGSALPEFTPETPQLAAVRTQSAEEQVSEEPPELERIQILNAQGLVKEEQLLVSITQMLVKEEPATAAIDGPSLCDRVKEQLPESKALSLLFIKQEQTEQSIAPPLINGPNIMLPGLNQDFSLSADQEEWNTNQNLDQNPNQAQNQGLNQGFNPSPDQQESHLGHILDQNPNQNPTQEQDLNEDFEEDNVEWEFEGLTPPRQSPDETENSSEEEDAFPPDHPPKLLRIHDPSAVNSGQRLNTAGGDSQDNALETDGERTENSSDLSDDEEPTAVKMQRQLVANLGNQLSNNVARTKELRIVCNNMIKTLSIVATEKDGMGKSDTGTKRKRKRRSSKKESLAGSNHTCTVCQRTFDSRKNMVAHMKAHAESVLCPVCCKVFKQTGFLAKHMKAHQSESTSQEAAGETGVKRKVKASHKKVLFKKRRKEEEEHSHTDPDKTEDSSDDN